MSKSGKFIDFIITQKCTYRCEYCSQSKCETKEQNNASKETIDAFLIFLDNLEKDFEITITGGEAILHPNFFEIIETIKKKGFKINLISNFSFNFEIYDKIFKTLEDSLNRFDLSFHLDEIADFTKTLNKLKLFLENKPLKTKTVLLVPIYKLTEEKEDKIKQLQELSESKNIKIEFQHIRILNKYTKNNPNEKKYLKDEVLEKSFSKKCCAGYKSAVIYENGEVYRCYSSRFLKSNSLGNIKEKNFNLNTEEKVCIQKYCTCPKPKSYGQITNEKQPLIAFFTKIRNIAFLPMMFIKNNEIVKIKLKQYFKLKQ